MYREKNKTRLISVTVLLHFFRKDWMQSWYQYIHKRCLLAEYRMSRKTVVYLVWSNTYVYSWYSIGIGKITQTASTQDLYIKGFNYIWQDDSYDKIKNCGICINNCIDGYSQKNCLVRSYLFKKLFSSRIVTWYFIT